MVTSLPYRYISLGLGLSAGISSRSGIPEAVVSSRIIVGQELLLATILFARERSLHIELAKGGREGSCPRA